MNCCFMVVELKDRKLTLRALPIVLAALLLFAGAAVRLTDLNDPPLDFNPTRQLRSAIIARGIFYAAQPDADPGRREIAAANRAAMEKLEPPILERLAAAVYPLTGETIAVPRTINTLLWFIGGGALFLWGAEMAGAAGGLTALAYFLFLPFSVYASRSFQPDPGMVVWLALTGWTLHRWNRVRSWKWAVLAGVFGGLAILTKVAAVFFAGGAAAGTLLAGPRRELRGRLKEAQVYAIAGLMLLPAALYYLVGIGAESGSYLANWTVVSRWREVLTLSFYMRWLIRVDGLLILPLVLLGFTGSLAAGKTHRSILWGLWGGYAAYGIFFPYHITTHDYYHLPLVFITAISLAPFGGLLWEQLAKQSVVARLAFAAATLIALIYPAWIARSVLVGQDYRDAPAYWELVGSEIPPGSRAVGYSQDYGFRLMYYGWRTISVLPEGASSNEFNDRYAGADYFVITAKNQLSADLAANLEANYPVHAEGGGYTIYDLRP